MIARIDDGTLWSWGQNSQGQLGIASTTSRSTPARLTTLTTVTSVAAGTTHAIALRADGTVWACGANSDGQLGDGTTTGKTSPTPISFEGNPRITAVAAGDGFSVALDDLGNVWTWGGKAHPAAAGGALHGCVDHPLGLVTVREVGARLAGAQHRVDEGSGAGRVDVEDRERRRGVDVTPVRVRNRQQLQDTRRAARTTDRAFRAVATHHRVDLEGAFGPIEPHLLHEQTFTAVVGVGEG